MKRISIFLLLVFLLCEFNSHAQKQAILNTIDTKMINNPAQPMRASDLNAILKSILNYPVDTVWISGDTIKYRVNGAARYVRFIGYQDSLNTAVKTYGIYNNPSWLNTISYAKLIDVPSVLIAGNNLADVSNVSTARENLSVYSISVVNDSLLNHYTKGQSDSRFKYSGWVPGVSDVTGLPDSLLSRYTKAQADARYKPISYIQDWLELTGVPSNFSTTYALSNDVKDSILARLRLIDTSGMLSPYRRTSTLIQQSEVNGLSTSLGAKLNTGDTSSMLSGYVRNGTVVKYSDTASVLSGYARNGNVVKYTDINVNNGVAGLDPGGKLPFSLLPAALMIYKGTWNVATNTPSLSDGTGVTGWIYIVSVGGTVNTGSGSITYSAGDYAIYNGTAWERSVGTNNVASVNGQQGVVTLTTSNIGEGTNLYYTDTRARAAFSAGTGIGLASGVITNTAPDQTVSLTNGGNITITGTYPNFTLTNGITNNNQLTNGAGYITSSALTPYLLLAGGTMSGSINMGTNSISNVNNFSAINLTGTGTANLPFATVIEAGNAGAGGNYDIFVKANSNNVVKLRTKAELISDLGLLTGNQTITLSGDVSGSGATAITTTIGALKVTNGMLAGSIDYAKMNAATVPTWNQNTTGNAATATSATQWSGNTYAGGAYSSAPTFVMGFDGTNWRSTTAAGVQSFLGLGLYAYRSSGLAELSGAAFTGGITGTTVSFSGNGAFGSLSVSSGGAFFGGSALMGNGIYGIRNNDNTVGYGAFGRSGLIEGNSNTEIGIFSETGFNVYTGGSGAVKARFNPDGSLNAGNIGGVTNKIGTFNMGLSGGGYAAVGYNIRYTTSSGIYQYDVTDASWMLDLGNYGQFRLRYAPSGTAGTSISYTDFITVSNTGAATFSSNVTTGDYIIIPNNKALFWNSISSDYIYGNSGTVTIGTANTDRVSINSTKVQINQTTASTSTTTGALVVTGGVGVGGAVYAGGDVVAYSTSDRRLKDNIRPIENALYKVGQLSGNEFDWNSNQQTYQGHDYGVIAQEVAKVLPYAVTIRETGFYGVKYERIIPLLIESIKELKKEVDLLKSK